MHHFHYKKGALHVEGVSLEVLADNYGTPLYVYSAQTLLDHYNGLDKVLAPVDHMICYAMKANSNLAVLSLLAKQGSGFDIVSAGELYRVIKAGGKASRCVFAGVGKTAGEIEYALKQKVYSFTVESSAELELINKIAARLKVKAPVAIRVNPNVDAKTHAKITTGTYENKFGIPFEEISSLYAKAARLKNIWLRGVQMHIGSQITSVAPFKKAVQKMVPLVLELKKKFKIEYFDVGGGLGIVYDHALQSGSGDWWAKQTKAPLTPKVYADAVMPLLKDLGLRILLEPGRFIAGNAGVLVSEVVYVKKTKKKNFVIVDAAMNDLIRPAFYESFHEIVPLMKKTGKTIPSDVVGPVCESGDTFCKERPLPPLQQKDRIVFMSAGAYGFVMASNYNSRPMAAELLVKGEKIHLARQRQKLEDLVRGEKAG